MEMDMQNADQIINQLTELAFTYGPKLLGAIITLIVGFWVIKLIVGVLQKGLNRANVDASLQSFLKSLASIGLKVLLFVSVAGMIGIEMTSFIAILGAAGLAVGLALQGSLANFAGGVLILFFKPFKVGDYIDNGSESGTVEKIDILHTVLVTPQNQTIIIPNGQLANAPITNYNEKDTRQARFPVGIGYTSDVKKARQIILDVLNSDERTLADPAAVVVLTELADSSLNLSARAWVNTSDYWDYFFENLESIKEELDKAGIEIPFPQRDVHLYQQK